MLMQRRDILKLILSSAALTAGWGITSASAATTKTPAAPLPKEIKTKSLITLGTNANRFPDTVFDENKIAKVYGTDNCSIMTEVNIHTEQVRQSVVPVKMGHGVQRIKNGNLVATSHHHNTAALLDEEHTPIKVFNPPEGYVFGGHSMIFPEKNIVIVPVRHANPHSTKDTGRLLVYDATDFKPMGEYDSGGIHPHEIRLLPERDEFVVTHYGDIDGTDPEGFYFNVIEPKLSVLDSGNFSTKREYLQPIDAIYTHMDVGKGANVYAVANQYIRYRKKSSRELKKLLKSYNFQPKNAIPRLSSQRNKMAVPLGVIRVDAITGNREVFLTSNEDFLRSQSIAANPKSGRIFATYSFSNNLIVIDEATKKVTVKSAYDYGFRDIRGVTNIPNTNYVAISDKEQGIVIINATTLEKIKDFPIYVLSSPHIFAG